MIYLPGTRIFCVQKTHRPRPALLPCADPNDWTPGSCARINVARLLDHYEHMLWYGRYVAALCQLKPVTP